MVAQTDLQEMDRLIRSGEAERAIDSLEAAVREEPLYGTARVLLAAAYEEEGRREDAAQAWLAAYRLVPNSTRVHSGLRRCLLGSKKAEPGEAPEAAEPRQPDTPRFTFEDIDSLIDELETARMKPAVDADSIPPPDLDRELDEVVSETLARIYANQKQYADAARVYRKLADQEPSGGEEYRERAREMSAMARQQEADEAAEDQ